MFLLPGGDGEGRGLGVREARPEVSHGSLATISLPPGFHNCYLLPCNLVCSTFRYLGIGCTTLQGVLNFLPGIGFFFIVLFLFKCAGCILNLVTRTLVGSVFVAPDGGKLIWITGTALHE
jgi:hypothetical protein